MNIGTKSFKHVSFLWDNQKADTFEGDEVGLLIYRSNILGSDLRITNYGGGNTSCRTMEKDPLTGAEVPVMWVKGSGGDIGTLTKSGLAGLYLDRLHALKSIYRGLEFEDEMVELFNHCIYDLNSKAPSIDTPLHAFLPYRHIDHLHPDALIAIAAAKDGEEIIHSLFGDTIAWTPWQRPGFDLGLKLEAANEKNSGLRGIVLGGHGLFTWGDNSFDCYINSLEVIEKCSRYLEDNYGKKRAVFGGVKTETKLSDTERKGQAAALAPTLRGLCSSENLMVGHFTDAPAVMEFINSKDVERLAAMGTSCPDHFLRTKICPLVLDMSPETNLQDTNGIVEKLEKQFDDYRKNYKKYYEDHKHPNSPAMRDPNPVVIIWPGIGMFTFAKNKQTARVAAEFYVNAINVMKGAEAVSSYVALPLQEAFDIEYWLLEEAKLKRMPAEKPLSRKIALITGSAGGIGKAIAEKFVQEGACVILTDNDPDRLAEAKTEFEKKYGKDNAIALPLDVTDSQSLDQAIEAICLQYGGVDIIVNNAGISISRAFDQHTLAEWDSLLDILVKGQFIVSQKAHEILKKQKKGGDIINIVSKNALVAGPKNAAYGTAKAAQLHLSRLMAAELAEHKIRVNVINPDAVIENSKIWESGWAEDRSKAYGVALEELPKFYANRTLLKEPVRVDDIALAAFAFVNGLLNKSTGNILNVDGGFAPSFPR
ncbi:bifunctional aldolase/short-chain dehydrogenase [Pararhodonellum marinum]|uniref:bifunctional aldolase/short-chain dehydrogenase n=1 Tax=Pararhodonellum marinum TaxID=2755358 RepID=UPI00188EB373|nr:bifunctional aldolase/short-chain dehydrogenase [Pararhodonellum marinum]